jgi:hypothetical protein
MHYDDNDVNFYLDGQSQKEYTLVSGKFTVTDFAVTEGQDPERKIFVGLTVDFDKNGVITFRVGRKGSSDTANWFNNKVPAFQTTFNHSAETLNFAFLGTLVMKIQGKHLEGGEDSFTFSNIVLAQGHTGAANNWLFGGQHCFNINHDKVIAQGIDSKGREVKFVFLRGGNNYHAVEVTPGNPRSTHVFLTNQGLSLLHAEIGDEFFHSLFTNDAIRSVLIGCTAPDGDETDWPTFQGHFFNYSTGLNYLGHNSPTAMQRFVNYWGEAKAKLKNKDPKWALTLGRALHYFEDMTAPFHAANDATLLSHLDFDHSEFEERAEEWHDDFKVDHCDLYGIGISMDLMEFAKVANHMADSVYHRYELTSKKDKWRQGAEEALKDAQMAVAALLYRFTIEAFKAGWFGDKQFLINLAIGKPAIQSSIDPELPPLIGPSRYVDQLDRFGCAAKAVDGDTDGNLTDNTVSQTGPDNKAWWMVDLLRPYEIKNIEIYDRTHVENRLSNFTVKILDENSHEKWSQHESNSKPPRPLSYNPGGVFGQYVVIDMDPELPDAYHPRFGKKLSLAEVKVLGIWRP